MDRHRRGMIGSIAVLVTSFAILSVVLLPSRAGAAEGGRTMRPRPALRQRPLVAQQRTEDRGFSLTLTSPDEAYLVGPQRVTVEPTVPPGDVLERADFFIDGKLVFTDRVSPFQFQNDFSDEILQHTIVVRARTLDGREARVSFVSRSADISDSAAGPIEVVPAVVRDAEGQPVVGLKVSDFSLLENGVSRPIIHFDSTPAPVSIVVALHDRDLDPEDRAALLRGAAEIGDDLPRHHALAFVDGSTLASAPGPHEGGSAFPFSHDRDVYRKRLGTALGTAPVGGAASLAELLDAAARAVQERRGGRALLLLMGGPPPPPPAPEISPQPEASPDGAPPSPGTPASALAPESTGARASAGAADLAAASARAAAAALQEEHLQTLASALQELQRARVTINVLLAGDADPGTAEIALLRRTAIETGGEFLVLTGGSDPQMAFLRVAESLLHRYLISFQPRQPERGGDSIIAVRVRRPHLMVNAPTALSGE